MPTNIYIKSEFKKYISGNMIKLNCIVEHGFPTPEIKWNFFNMTPTNAEITVIII